jgi:cytochrome o ubiquinol oxidase subunit 1
MKQRSVEMKAAVYRPIHMPRNTGTGFVMAVFLGLAAFAMIWHIWWLAIGGVAAAMVALVHHAFDDDRDYYVEAEEVRRTEVLRGRAQLRSV